MLYFDMIQCGFIVLCLMVAGEFISHKMKAAVPSILASAVLFLVLIWCKILPPTLVKDSGLIHLTSIAMMFIILGMGISTNPKELLANWRVVAVAALSYIGQTAIVIMVIGAIFDQNTAIGGLPGGAAVALIVQERAKALGYSDIVVLSALLLSIQGLVSCPLVSWMIKNEVYRFKRVGISSNSANTVSGNTSVIGTTNSQSPYWSLIRFFAAAWLASRLEMITGISKYVFCLLLGVFFANIGIFRKNEMERSKSHGFLTLMMMTMVLDGFSNATPSLIAQLIVPITCILLVDVFSIFLLSLPLGKLFGFSKSMSFAISLNVLVGFPLNLMLAQDIIEYMVEKPEEKEFLNQQIATKLVIAGFTSVTFLSTIGAGLLVNLMK